MKTNRIKKIASLIRDVPNFPKPGIIFKDITPLIGDATGLKLTLDMLAQSFVDQGITTVVGMESRGFIFGVPVAERLNVGFVPVRKPGKLPAAVISEQFELEYGSDTLQMHKDALSTNDRVLIVDDLLATGGTAAATIRMIKNLGATVAGATFVIELDFLKGRERLSNVEIKSLLHY